MSAPAVRTTPNSGAGSPPSPARGTVPRFGILDVARGSALLAMAAYHTTWDLGYLALTPENYALSPLGKVAAHLIAGTFLVLVGIGLVLMNREGMRPRPFLLRLARIGIAALLITAATRYAFPDSYIFFGILHCIAVSSVLALPFLRLPPVAALVAGLAVLAVPVATANPDYHLAVFDDPTLSFLGFGTLPPRTNDYVPLFPWFGLVLLGVALARAALPAFLRTGWPAWRPRAFASRALALAGRHSLVVYLVHQPLLLAVLTGVVTLTGPHPRAGMAEFRMRYEANCALLGGDTRTCRISARCALDSLRLDGLWAIRDRSFTPEERERAQGYYQACNRPFARPSPLP